MKSFYRQQLPHIQPLGTTFFVTFRLYGSVPVAQLSQLKNNHERKTNRINKQLNTIEKNTQTLKIRKLYFTKYDQLLDTIKQGPTYLEKPITLNILKEQLHRFDGELYDLIAHSIMSNHVHILIDTQRRQFESHYKVFSVG